MREKLKKQSSFNMATFFIVVFIILLFLFGSFVYLLYSDKKKETFYIGLAGPFSGSNKALGLYMKRGAELAIKEINKSNDFKDIKLELIVKDDRSEYTSTYRPIEIAKEIAKQKNLLAVVGHYFSGPTRATASIYTQKKIPVISPTASHPAVTQSSDWIFSIIFNDDFQANYLANYVLYALNKKKIMVIHSDIAYGQRLAKTFIQRLKENNINPGIISIKREKFNPESLEKYMGQIKKSDMIFLAMRYDTAAQIVKYIRIRGIKNVGFIGGENIGSFRFIEEAGVYSENVYAIKSFLSNLLGKSARSYQRRFKKEYSDEADWSSAHSYEAVHLIAKAVKQVGTDRSDIKNYLARLKSAEKGVKSIGGKIFFDKDGSCARPVAMGQVKNGKYISAKSQLTYVKYPELIKKNYKKGSVVQFNNRFIKKTRIVFTGLYTNKIEEINISESFFIADCRLWFRWKGDEDKFEFEFPNGKIIGTPRIIEENHNSQTKEHYISYLIKVKFRGYFPLQQYPFDEQTLEMQIKPKNYSTEDLILVRDTTDDLRANEKLDLGIWIDIEHISFVDIKNYLFSIKNPKYDNKVLELNYSLFNVNIHIKRRTTEYLVKLTPLFIIVLITYLTFFINIEKFTPSRIAMGITALLSAVAFHMSQGSSVNNIGYLIKADIFFIMTYMLISLTLIETVIASRYYFTDKIETSKKIDHFSAIIFPILIVSGVIILYF